MALTTESMQAESNPCYERFRTHLRERGFKVFPHEFACRHSEHPFVDLAGRMGNYFWAFEYKSASDSISRGVQQVLCYREWFDYVVLVTEKALDHRFSDNYWELKRIGVGMWFYDKNRNSCEEKTNPLIQSPDKSNRIFVKRKFESLGRLDRKSPKRESVGQLSLWDFELENSLGPIQ